MPDLIFILFAFLLGACIGSFLNVVVWRLPRGESLVTPPSHCPKCDRPLKWYDNLPIVGWIKLGGRCRYCKESISIRYPVVEAVTGLLFALYYVMLFMADLGPCKQYAFSDGIAHFVHEPLNFPDHWPIYALDMLLVAALLAASLIDAELFIIPLEIPWVVAAFALLAHAAWDKPGWPGGLNASPFAAALAAGGALGVIVSILLVMAGILPMSFPDGGPLLEVDKAKLASEKKTRSATDPDDAATQREYSPAEIRAEMRKEMLFLLPPLALGFASVVATARIDSLRHVWETLVAHLWVSGLLGSMLGLLMGGFVVWLTRILGSYGFGREAMGMGDVHLMAGVGAVLGGGAATVAFLAPFFGIVVALYMILTGTRRELPYGPYLSLATAFVILFYCPIAQYLAPGVAGLTFAVSRLMGGG